MLKFVIFVVILRASQKITLTQCYFKWNHPYGCQTDKFARVRLCTLTMLLNQTQLQLLHLSDMFLTNLTLEMDHLIDLKFLDLSQNKIQCLYTSTLRGINTIIGYTPGKQNVSRNLEMDLSDNPLRCSCLCIEFYEWMRNVRLYITFTNLESYQCTFDNGRKVSLSNLHLIVDILHSQCVSTDWVLVIKIVTTMLFLYCLILTATMLFRFRHTLRLHLAEAQNAQTLSGKTYSGSKI